MKAMNKAKAQERAEISKTDVTIPEVAERLGFTDRHKMFADLYVWGGAEVAGNPAECFVQVFGEMLNKNMKSAYRAGSELLAEEGMSKYVEKQMADMEKLFKIEKIRNIQTLVDIRDEMSKAQYVNRFGEVNGVPACRNTAISAVKQMNDMMGFKSPTEVNVNHGVGGGGVTFNIIIPDAKPKIDISNAQDAEEVI